MSAKSRAGISPRLVAKHAGLSRLKTDRLMSKAEKLARWFNGSTTVEDQGLGLLVEELGADRFGEALDAALTEEMALAS